MTEEEPKLTGFVTLEQAKELIMAPLRPGESAAGRLEFVTTLTFVSEDGDEDYPAFET